MGSLGRKILIWCTTTCYLVGHLTVFLASNTTHLYFARYTNIFYSILQKMFLYTKVVFPIKRFISALLFQICNWLGSRRNNSRMWSICVRNDNERHERLTMLQYPIARRIRNSIFTCRRKICSLEHTSFGKHVPPNSILDSNQDHTRKSVFFGW